MGGTRIRAPVGASRPRQGDFVHLTGAGYRLVGSMLFGELMAQYNRFLTVRAEGANGQ